MEIPQMIKLLQEIHASFSKDGCTPFFPVFLTLDQARAELRKCTKQECDLPSFEAEWVTGNAYGGNIIYQYEDIFIKVSFT